MNLSSVELKLGRAQEHLDNLRAEIKSWQAGTPFRLECSLAADSHAWRAVVRVNTPPPLERWGLAFGDGVHNLRAALDHLVYQIAVDESRRDPPPNVVSLLFPILDTLDAWEDDRTRSRLEHLSGDTKAILRSVQPFHRPDANGHRPLLGLLRDCDDSDKHRILRLTMCHLTGAAYRSVTGLPPGQNVRLEFSLLHVVDGTELAAISSPVPMPALRVGMFDVVLHVTIAVPPGPNRVELIDVLMLADMLKAEVDDVVHTVASNY